MIGWIVAGAVVLVIFVLAFFGTGRDRHRADVGMDITGAKAQGTRNDAGGLGSL